MTSYHPALTGTDSKFSWLVKETLSSYTNQRVCFTVLTNLFAATMPIRLTCPCGKALNVADTMAGKTVKCPGCGKAIQVPGGGTAPRAQQAAPARPAPAGPTPPSRPAPMPMASKSNRMDDLFDEEGFTQQVEAVCPSCRAEMPGYAILCTKCGYNKETGQMVQSHKTAGVDISHSELALEKAASDMEKEKVMQQKLIAGAGLPWWGYALVLFGLGSGLMIAVLVVNASRRVDESVPFNPLGLFFTLMGSAFAMVALGAYWMIVVHGFKTENKRGLLTLIPPYAFYYVFKHPRATWKFLAVAIVAGGVAGGLFAAASANGGI
jgi:hypothetical protein